ncbi:FkbM family methyltransferase [Azospirillum sp. SYSU D00513]|uniref:FkbM family methyltransferase n=1 Tax=Azospirillum sp. SYSU D00513 TaxID=2812561 RepID=UPI001A969EAE|nr:FkbM family methyltransferase [Azospirillum sp. SYSU D00513]
MASITDINDIPRHARIFIYGAGVGGGALYGFLTASGRQRDVGGFIETVPKARPLTVRSFSPQEYAELRRPDDVVLIASTSFEDMAATLDRLGIDNYRIALPLLAAHLDGQQLWPLEFCRRHVRKAGLSIDVGANIGLMTALFARFSERVIAFEPNRTLAGKFARLTAGCAGVELVHLACGSASGPARLHLPLPGNEAGDLLYEVTATLNEPGWAHQAVEVEQVTLDAFCASRGIRPDFIKIDAEWLDYEVIRGARRLIETSAPVLLFEAYRLDEDCLGMLRRHYELIAIPEHDQIVAHGAEPLMPLDRFLARSGGKPPLNIGAVPR